MCNQLQLRTLARPLIIKLGNLVRPRNDDGLHIQLTNIRALDHEEINKNKDKIKQLVLRSPEVKKAFVEIVRGLNLDYYRQNKAQCRSSHSTCEALISRMMPTDSLTAAACSALDFGHFSSLEPPEGISASASASAGSGPNSQSQPQLAERDEADETFRIFAEVVLVMADISSANSSGVMGTTCCNHLKNYLEGMKQHEKWEEAMQVTISVLIPWLKYMCYSVSTAEGMRFIEEAYASVKNLLLEIMNTNSTTTSTQEAHVVASQVLHSIQVLDSLNYSALQLFQGAKRNEIGEEFTRVQSMLLQKIDGTTTMSRSEAAAAGNQIAIDQDCSAAKLPEDPIYNKTRSKMHLLEHLARRNPEAIDLLLPVLDGDVGGQRSSLVDRILSCLEAKLVERSASLTTKGEREFFLMANYDYIVDGCENGSLRKVVEKRSVDQIASKLQQQIDKYNTIVWEDDRIAAGCCCCCSTVLLSLLPKSITEWRLKRCHAAGEALKSSQLSRMQPRLRQQLKDRFEACTTITTVARTMAS